MPAAVSAFWNRPSRRPLRGLLRTSGFGIAALRQREEPVDIQAPLDLLGDRVERCVDAGAVVLAAARRAEAREQRSRAASVEAKRPWQ